MMLHIHIHTTDKHNYQIFTSAHAGDIHYLTFFVAVTTITADTEQSWLATMRPKIL